MKFLRVLALAVCALVAGCTLFSSTPSATPAPAASTVTVQAEARGALQIAADLWNAAVDICADAKSTNPAAYAQCRAILLPARDGLVSAGGALDAWTSASQGQVVCAVEDATGAVVQAANTLGAGPDPAVVADALALAHALGTCPAKDGGK